MYQLILRILNQHLPQLVTFQLFEIIITILTFLGSNNIEFGGILPGKKYVQMAVFSESLESLIIHLCDHLNKTDGVNAQRPATGTYLDILNNLIRIDIVISDSVENYVQSIILLDSFPLGTTLSQPGLFTLDIMDIVNADSYKKPSQRLRLGKYQWVKLQLIEFKTDRLCATINVNVES